MDTLNPIEREALKNAIANPDFASGLKKFCSMMADKFTVQCRNRALEMPDTVNAEVRRRVQIEQAAAKAKAYMQFETLFRLCAHGGSTDTEPE